MEALATSAGTGSGTRLTDPAQAMDKAAR